MPKEKKRDKIVRTIVMTIPVIFLSLIALIGDFFMLLLKMITLTIHWPVKWALDTVDRFKLVWRGK